MQDCKIANDNMNIEAKPINETTELAPIAETSAAKPINEAVPKDSAVDVQENEILQLDGKLLDILLKDRSTNANIMWCTDDYAELGAGYGSNDQIMPELITGDKGEVIRPRAVKSKEEQLSRTREKAEVMTPTWICNKMNNLVDEAWFERAHVFNEEADNGWTPTQAKIEFPKPRGKKSWRDYIAAKRLEITCGEAPYLVSRYDTVTGASVPLERRIGLLDRKLRVINERLRNFKDTERAQKRWYELARIALQSIYGFEWQGDNILLARENLLFTLIDYYKAKFNNAAMPLAWLEDFANIISWNIWQMDGIKCVVPETCHEYKKQPKVVEPNLFDNRANSASVLKRSVGFCDVDEAEIQKCQGCLKDNVDLHNGKYSKIKNWSTGRILRFKDLLSGQGSENSMSKDFKFDVVIGNPPYQVSDGGNKSSAVPVYHYFINSIRKIQPDYMSVIIPARWFAGGKGLDEFRESMISDTHIKVLNDYLNSVDCFGTAVEIKGGVCYLLWDKKHNDSCRIITHMDNGEISVSNRYMKIGDNDIFIRRNEAISIYNKVTSLKEMSFSKLVSFRKPFGLATNVNSHKDYRDGDIALYVHGGIEFYQRKDITRNQEWIDKYKIYITKAYNAGDVYPHQIINKPLLADSQSACSETYLVVGPFDTVEETKNVISYMKTKFFRFLVSMRKISQDATQKVYSFVPMQDFSVGWTDNDLYKKYGISADEIAFIESMIKPME